MLFNCRLPFRVWLARNHYLTQSSSVQILQENQQKYAFEMNDNNIFLTYIIGNRNRITELIEFHTGAVELEQPLS